MGPVESKLRTYLRLTVDYVATLVLLGALSPLFADVFFGHFSELAARIEHLLLVGITFLPELAAQAGYLPRTGLTLSDGLQAVGITAVSAALLSLGAALIDVKPGERPSLKRRVLAQPFVMLCGVPALLIAVTGVLFGAALEPRLFLVLLAAGILGGLLSRARRRDPIPWEASLSGLPPATWRTDHLFRFLLLFSLMLLYGGAAIASWSPSDLTLLPLAAQLDTALGPTAIPLGFAASLLVFLALAPPTRRALGLMSWEPLAGGVLGASLVLTFTTRGTTTAELTVLLSLGATVGVVGAALAAAGGPAIPRLSLHPVRATGRLLLPLAVAGAVTAWVLGVDFLACNQVLEDPRVEQIGRNRGAVSLALTEGEEPALFAALRRDGFVSRIALDEERIDLIDPVQYARDLPNDPGEARFLPSMVASWTDDRVLIIADIEPDDEDPEGPPPAPVGLTVEAATTWVDSIAQAPRSCLTHGGAWAWNPLLSLVVIGCADRGEALLYEPDLQGFIAQMELRGAERFSGMVVDPSDGAVIGVARQENPFLLALDVRTGSTLGWRFLGAGNQGLFLDQDGVLLLGRTLARQVLTLDPSTLTPVDSLPTGFGLSSVIQDPISGRVVAGSSLDGHLYAVDPLGDRAPRTIRVGGLVRDLELSQAQRKLYVAGLCGILSVDLENWLGR
ncbi:MAG: hypothetical protein CL928_12675 [Deltaproteobacteria bacterium]|nr:hypothetical protein [Deltaproteobacteria bacterium]